MIVDIKKGEKFDDDDYDIVLHKSLFRNLNLGNGEPSNIQSNYSMLMALKEKVRWNLCY